MNASPAPPALRFERVTKRFGKRAALDSLSFEVPQGSLCGFVGANGAGKTTTFAIAGGYCAPDEGVVDVLGGPFDPWRLKGRLGLLPQDADIGDRHTPRELLVHLARLQGMTAAKAGHDASRVLDRVHLDDRADVAIGTLSHGMRRRVAVATALLGSPDLVVLDEPTAGLDPVQVRSLRDVFTQRRPGQTFVVSTHNLDEVERICDYVVFIDQGRLVKQGPIDDVVGRDESAAWVLGAAVPLALLTEVLPGYTLEATGEVLLVRGRDLDAASVHIARVLAEQRIPVREVRRGGSLEERFFGASPGAARPG